MAFGVIFGQFVFALGTADTVDILLQPGHTCVGGRGSPGHAQRSPEAQTMLSGDGSL